MPPKPVDDPAVLILANGLDIGQKHGGAEVFAAELALALPGLGWRPYLGLLAHTGTSAEQEWRRRLAAGGVEALDLNPGRRRDLGRSLWRAAGLCRAKGIELVHSHSQFGSLVALGLRWGLPGLGVVRTAHTSFEWGLSLPAKILNGLFPQFLLSLTFDAQVAVSRAIAAQIEAYPGMRLRRRRAVYIPNALADEWFAPPAPPRPNQPAAVIGAVGVLTANKDQACLIRAVGLLPPDDPPFEVWLVGDGPERANLEALAAGLGLGQRVRFLGQRRDLRALFAQMDLSVLASRREGLATSILESMACRVAVIASDIPANRELIEPERSGWLFPPGDAPALAATIRQALQAPARRAQVAQAAAGQVEAFRMSGVAARYARLYQETRQMCRRERSVNVK